MTMLKVNVFDEINDPSLIDSFKQLYAVQS